MKTTKQTRVEAHNPKRSAWGASILTALAGKRVVDFGRISSQAREKPSTWSVMASGSWARFG